MARADGGQLVGVAHEQHVRLGRHRAQQRGREAHVEHGGFVHDEEIALQRVARVHGKAAAVLGAVELEQAVDRLGVHTRGLAQALGGAARGRGEEELRLFRLQNIRQRAQDGRLARARAAGEHGKFFLERGNEAGRLLRRKGKARAVLRPRHGFFHRNGRQGGGSGEQAVHALGNGLFGLFVNGQLQQALGQFDQRAVGHEFLHPRGQQAGGRRRASPRPVRRVLRRASTCGRRPPVHRGQRATRRPAARGCRCRGRGCGRFCPP